jgi:hypothetical protein
VVARLLVALIVVLPYAFPAAVPAASKPGPKELWEKFPLEPTPSPTRPVAAPRDRVRVVRTDGGIGPIAMISLMLLAAGAGATTVALAVTRRRQSGPAPTAAPVAAPKPARPPRVRVGPTLLAPTPRAAAPPRPPVPAPRAKRAIRPAPSRRTPTPEAVEGIETCRINLWQGYVTNRFYAAAQDRRDWIAHSSQFSVQKGLALEESPAAEQALGELLDGLIAAGWELVDRGPAKFDVTLRRNAGAAPQQPVA